MSFPYDESFYCEEYGCQFWEAYCKDYAAGWFIRYEILESPLHEDAKEPCAPRGEGGINASAKRNLL